MAKKSMPQGLQGKQLSAEKFTQNAISNRGQAIMV